MIEDKIYDYFHRAVEGGVSKSYSQLFEEMVEEGVVTQEYFDDNELKICGIFDDNWFTCEGCDWTITRGQESYNHPDYCTDCEEDED